MQDLHKWKQVSPIMALVGVLVMFFPLYRDVQLYYTTLLEILQSTKDKTKFTLYQ